MAKLAIFILLTIIVGTIAIIAITTCLTWIRHLWDADRQIVRDETREALWAHEDLKDATARQAKRKTK